MTTAEEKNEIKQILREKQKLVKYDIRDYPIEYIVEKFKKSEFYIPQYQRKFVWTDNVKSRFIESVLLGLPIPFLFLSENSDSGNLEIVDGAQRIQTLNQYLNNSLKLNNLKELPILNGRTFNDLPAPEQRNLKNRALRMIILDKETAETTRKEIFHRINTSGVKATPVEIRMGIYEGPFIDVVRDCATNTKFIENCPIHENKLSKKEDLELIFRFFAFSDDLDNYDGNPANFIDNYTKQMTQNYSDSTKQKHIREFNQTINFADQFLPHGFKKSSTATSTPRVRFEALAVGINLALRQNPNLQIEDVSWLESDEFKNVTSTDAANNKTNVYRRINYVKEKLLQ